MSESQPAGAGEMLAIEVGTSRVKLGKFALGSECVGDKPATALPIAPPPLPEPLEATSVAHGRDLTAGAERELSAWLTEHVPAGTPIYLASVHPTVSQQLVELLSAHGWRAPRLITWREIPLDVRVDEPERVGIDRLLDAVAANRLRSPGRPAIVVDLGTAGTVNLVAADGGFEGGAIFPGLTLAAESLHAGTASLPHLDAVELGAAPVLGKNTGAAIAAGVYWGTVGAVREIAARLADECQTPPHLFVTGGAAHQVVEQLGLAELPPRHVPHMVLSGIRIVAEQLR